MNFKGLLLFIVILVIAIIILKWLKKFKFPKISCLCLVCGGVKSGKTTFALALAYSKYKQRLRQWKFRSIFDKSIEKPLFYSNIALKVPHVRITDDFLLRKVRPAKRSVCYISEASLVADSMLFKDNDINFKLLMFNKLFGHSSLGGLCIYDTQNVEDLHFGIRRALSEYIYIHHLETHIPFLIIAKVREERMGINTINNYSEDIEDSLKKVLFTKKVWKIFDCFTYSVLTDNLPVLKKEVISKDLKTRNIVSFNPNIKYINEKEIKENA